MATKTLEKAPVKTAESTTIQPTGRRVLVRRETAQEATPGGILLPDQAKELPRQGTVLAIGPGQYDNGVFVEVQVGIGQTVLFGAYAGHEVPNKQRDKDLLLMEENDILATVS